MIIQTDKEGVKVKRIGGSMTVLIQVGQNSDYSDVLHFFVNPGVETLDYGDGHVVFRKPKPKRAEQVVKPAQYKCEGCGEILNPEDRSPYGDGWCHIVPVHVCGGDERACMMRCPEAEPCGPVWPLNEQAQGEGEGE